MSNLNLPLRFSDMPPDWSVAWDRDVPPDFKWHSNLDLYIYERGSGNVDGAVPQMIAMVTDGHSQAYVLCPGPIVAWNPWC